MSDAFTIGDRQVQAGTRATLELPLARLFTGSWMSLPVAVVHGEPGPRLWLSAAIHGDELNGMEIIRRVLLRLDPRRLRGTVVAVPVVNVFGFVEQSRYLPDRRDLNRSFPGSPKGSLASRVAHLFVEEVVRKCDYGLDFHTGSLHRSNLPQIRCDHFDAEMLRLAHAFGAPVMFRSPPIKGTLRSTARRLGIHYLLFEGGEPLRFDSDVIDCGVDGTLRVLSALGMASFEVPEAPPSLLARTTRWLRASRSGILHLQVGLGEPVHKGQVLGEILVDFFSRRSVKIRASDEGLVLGHTNTPLINQGDALVHLALR